MNRLVSVLAVSMATVLLTFGVQAAQESSAPVVIGANDQPIHDAARLGSGKDVEKILKSNPAARDARTQHGSTPFTPTSKRTWTPTSTASSVGRGSNATSTR